MTVHWDQRSGGVWIVRSLALLMLAAIAVLFTVQPRRVGADAVASVSPDSGTLNTQFTFAVSGLMPGHGIEITITDGAANRFPYQRNGVNQALLVGDDGSASVTLTPATDFAGAVAGLWQAAFQEEETGAIATIPFAVTS